MNIAVYIARKLKGDATSTGRVSRMGTRIAIISVAVSVFTMILSVAIVRGFRSEIQKRAVGFTGEILMEAPGAGFVTEAIPVSTDLSYLENLKNHPDVNHIQEFAISYGIINTGDAIQAVSLKGVGAGYRWDFFERHLKEGSIPVFSQDASSSEIIISRRLSGLLQIGLQDVVTMYFIGDNVRMRRFIISGIYDAQLEDIDNHLIIGDIRHTQRLNGWREDQVSGIELFLNDKRRIEAQQESIEEFIIANSSDSDDGVVLRNVKRIYSHLYDWLDLMDINVVILLTLMVLVAGFNMMSGLLILLFEKTSAIGLFKAMGMKDRSIRNSFLYNAAGVALKGMTAGTVLAVIFLVIQKTTGLIPLDPSTYFVDSVPVDLSWYHVLLIDAAALGLLLGILILPLKSIIRISPDKAIRMR
jgi:lipoprotein-releasing system permease protein